MGETAAPRRGYTFRLAGRHLMTGCLRPRAAMREALDAGLSEPRRLVLATAGLYLMMAQSPGSGAALSRYLKMVFASERLFLIAVGFGILLVFLASFALVTYAANCVVLAVALSLTLWSGQSFATTRSVSVLVDWITVLPVFVLYAVMGLLGFPSSLFESWTIEPAQVLIVAPCLLLCLAEAFGLSIVTSSVVVLLAMAGDVVADAAIAGGLDLLTEFIQTFDKNIISA